MKRIYETGTEAADIKLNVDIGTAGTAFTSAYLARSGGQSSLIAQSKTVSGDIGETSIGDAQGVKSSYLVIRTTIDFSNMDQTEWQKQADLIFARYQIEGGYSGKQLYNHDLDDLNVAYGGKIVTITKAIEMK
ncbi:MAG TPA: hypothetical protein PKH02_01465 [Bacteroidales bacterium]|nr:hypothetical protein [Bacteroidales bacterium]